MSSNIVSWHDFPSRVNPRLSLFVDVHSLPSLVSDTMVCASRFSSNVVRLPTLTLIILAAVSGVSAQFFGNSTLRDAYDYVVIGGGPGGMTVANRLSEDSSVTVLLIEAGPMYVYSPVTLLKRDQTSDMSLGTTTKKPSWYRDGSWKQSPSWIINGSFSPLLRLSSSFGRWIWSRARSLVAEAPSTSC